MKPRLILSLLLCAIAVYAQAPQAKPQVKPRVSIHTSYGPVVVELEPALAPATVENFLNYVKSGYYSGTIFHRVIDGFMIQGGGFTESMTEKSANAPVRNESKAEGLKNVRGTIAMARTDDPNSATSQFFINLADNSKLDFTSASTAGIGYCVFGKVVSGMESVDKIAKVRTVWRKGFSDVPEFHVRITKTEILAEIPPEEPREDNKEI
jgi:cyclophilin family peptidyl-prolyl cis-trans isomerase